MAHEKTIYELANILHPPKAKFWINAETRAQAARALAESGSQEAVEPLVMALSDKKVRGAAASALGELPIPSGSRGRVLKALAEYREALVSDFMDEYFNPQRNPEVMTLSMAEDGELAKKEPEACLAKALEMVRQISPAKAQAMERCEKEGLAPGSREKFLENVRLLHKHGVFSLWPRIEKLDAAIQEAGRVMALLGGGQPEKAAPEEKAAPGLFNVVFSGEIREGADLAAVKKAVAALYKADVARIERLFSGQVSVLKRNVDRQAAEKLAEALDKTGAKARIQPAS